MSADEPDPHDPPPTGMGVRGALSMFALATGGSALLGALGFGVLTAVLGFALWTAWPQGGAPTHLLGAMTAFAGGTTCLFLAGGVALLVPGVRALLPRRDAPPDDPT